MTTFEQLFATLRARDTGYGSEAFQTACQAADALTWIEGHGPRAVWLRVWDGFLPLACYRLALPTVRLRLTPSDSGRVIGEHLRIRHRGRLRFHAAQGVIPLPPQLSDYLRGRRRQAVRTNLARARDAGFTVRSHTVPVWVPGGDDSRGPHLSPAPVERWTVEDQAGEIVADSILSVDEQVALLHGLTSSLPYARWLLHTAIVERLCGRCELLLINSDDVYDLPAGARHFQRLLGYQIVRLHLDDPPGRSPSPAREWVRTLLRMPAGPPVTVLA